MTRSVEGVGEQGALRRGELGARSLIVEDHCQQHDGGCVEIRVIGRARAGSPMPSTRYIPRRCVGAVTLALAVLAAWSGAAETVQRITPAMRWEVGGDSSEVFFGYVSAVVARGDEVYILDSQTGEITVVDAQGRPARTIGGIGEGPGELQLPIGMTFGPTNGIAVIQGYPAKVVELLPDGAPGAVIAPYDNDPAKRSSCYLVSGRYRSMGGYVLSGGWIDFASGGDRTTLFVGVFDPDGNVTDLIAESEMPNADQIIENGTYWPHVAVGQGGEVIRTTAWDRYEFVLESPGSDEVRTVRRDATDKTRSRRELDTVASNWLRQNPGSDKKFVPAKTSPQIVSVDVDASGHIWIGRSSPYEPLAPGVFMVFDVFSANGDFIKTVELVVEADRENDRLVFLDGKRFAVIRNYVCAGIAWSNSSSGSGSEDQCKEVTVRLLEIGKD